MKASNKWICFWLGVIAFLLLCGVILFAAYIYKFDPLSTVAILFNTDANVIWSAINVIATFVVGIITITVSVKLTKIQSEQATIEKMQSLLYTEPHILIDALTIKPAVCELTADGKMIKTVKDIDFPYYTNKLGGDHISNFSVLVVQIVNTSEAFARLRFEGATLTQGENIIAKYDMSTFGAHRNHMMLCKEGSCQIGLLISNDMISKLNHTKLTFTTILDNNFNEHFKDTQSYQIMNICEDIVTFMPYGTDKNTFEKM